MEMEEMMMMMMISRRSSPENLGNESISSDPITTSTTNCPTWKLYENPFYTNTPHKQHPQSQSQTQTQTQTQINHRQKQHHHHHSQDNKGDQLKQIHRLQLPISARKIAASFWDLTFIRPFMESELDMARAKITELKSELEQERKARKKAESMNKKLGRELSEGRKGREALERLCEELAKQVSSSKAEMNRMHRDMEDERKMLRTAEVLREERVQMKLGEAKLLLEEKLLELEAIRSNSSSTNKQMLQNIDDRSPSSSPSSKPEAKSREQDHINNKTTSGEEIIKSSVNLVEKSPSTNGSNLSAALSQRRASPEPENPHIKRGIKGFVEFPKVVRAIGSKSRHLGTKLECQKAQLRILLKQKTPIRSNSLITS